MTIRTAPALLFCGLTMAAQTLANASEGGDRHYQTVWNIERDPSQLGVRSTVTGRTILEQRLLPLGLA